MSAFCLKDIIEEMKKELQKIKEEIIAGTVLLIYNLIFIVQTCITNHLYEINSSCVCMFQH